MVIEKKYKGLSAVRKYKDGIIKARCSWSKQQLAYMWLEWQIWGE